MKKATTASSALLTPDANGWCLRLGDESHAHATLDEALASVPGTARLELALPCQAVLIERHRLPSTDRAELADMVQLQLEKSLPFPVEEVSHGFTVLGQDESESTVLSVAAHHSQLDQICAPLRQNDRVPERITLHALHVAAACPENETVLAVWPEQGQTVAGIVAGGKLAWAQNIAATAPADIAAEIPGLLLGAEVEGVPTVFTRIFATGDLALVGELGTQLGKPVEPLVLPPAAINTTDGGIDLLPSGWVHEASSRERGERLKQRLLIGAVLYLLLIAAAFIFLALEKRKTQALQKELAAMEPRFRDIGNWRSRWQSVAPSIEPQRFAMDVLHLLTKNRGKDKKVEFTEFRYSPREWTLTGEATTDSHFEFSQKLKKDPELTDYYNMPPPTPPYTAIQGSDKVKFSIVGKPL